MSRQPHRFLWKTLRSCLKRAGIDAFLRQPDYHYVPQYYGRKAENRTDIRSLPVFGALADRVIQQGRTFLYYDRLYIIFQSLVNVKRTLKGQNHFHSAEVGVYRGGTSYFIAAAAAALDLPITHYGFDTFAGHAEEDIDTEIDTHRARNFSDTDFAAVQEYLKDFEKVKVYKGRFQDACSEVAEKTFHFVHLDVDLYEPTRFALDFFDRRLVGGGIIIVDDYEVHTCPGIKKVVEEFLQTKPNYIAWHPLTEQCVLIKSLSEKPPPIKIEG